MTSFDPHRGSAILDFTFFLKSQEITEIDTKSSQYAYGKSTEEHWQKYIIMPKKLIFGETHVNFAIAIAKTKLMDAQLLLTYRNFRVR